MNATHIATILLTDDSAIDVPVQVTGWFSGGRFGYVRPTDWTDIPSADAKLIRAYVKSGTYAVPVTRLVAV